MSEQNQTDLAKRIAKALSEAPTPVTVCIDFDGVIHSYTSGWQGMETIGDPPVDGAFAAIEQYLLSGLRVAVFSSRSCAEEGIAAMRNWFLRSGMGEAVFEFLEFPFHKPPALLYIDDRGFHFKGKFPSAAYVMEFVPWFNKPEEEDAADVRSTIVSQIEQLEAWMWGTTVSEHKIVPPTTSEFVSFIEDLAVGVSEGLDVYIPRLDDGLQKLEFVCGVCDVAHLFDRILQVAHARQDIPGVERYLT